MSTQQISFDPLTYQDKYGLSAKGASNAALRERNAELKLRRARGELVSGFTLTGQLRPYASFGVPDGRVRNVYYVQVQS